VLTVGVAQAAPALFAIPTSKREIESLRNKIQRNAQAQPFWKDAIGLGVTPRLVIRFDLEPHGYYVTHPIHRTGVVPGSPARATAIASVPREANSEAAEAVRNLLPKEAQFELIDAVDKSFFAHDPSGEFKIETVSNWQ
jgi:hypothetical protein